MEEVGPAGQTPSVSLAEQAERIQQVVEVVEVQESGGTSQLVEQAERSRLVLAEAEAEAAVEEYKAE